MSWFSIALVLLSALLHALWNLLAHSKQIDGTLFIRANLITCVVALLPVLMAELRGDSFPLSVWGLLILSGVFHCFYLLGLAMGYRSGKFTVVYPVARALPILFLAFFDQGRGRLPDLLGWLGILLTIGGCVLAPLQSLRKVTAAIYWNRATFWILVVMVATVGYMTVDKLAAELLPTGPGTAARYYVLQAFFTIPFLWLTLKGVGEPTDKPMGLTQWKWAAVFALFVFSSYWLMLWAYQLNPLVSYLAAIRQFSIVIGVVLAIVIYREPVSTLRLGAAIAITLGTICISQAS